MLRVQTTVKPSLIHGLGLFTNQDIPKGAVVWAFDEDIDRFFGIPELRSRFFHEGGEQILRELYNWGWESEKKPGIIILGCDNTRFTNHSSDPTTCPDFESCKFSDSIEFDYIATRDIAKGEELTQDYRHLGNSSSGLKFWVDIAKFLEVPPNSFYDNL